MTVAFLRNVWYPLAWGTEVGDGLFHRTLLNEPIVAYRRGDGVAVALADTCPHRFAPLHLAAPDAGNESPRKSSTPLSQNKLVGASQLN